MCISYCHQSNKSRNVYPNLKHVYFLNMFFPNSAYLISHHVCLVPIQIKMYCYKPSHNINISPHSQIYFLLYYIKYIYHTKKVFK